MLPSSYRLPKQFIADVVRFGGRASAQGLLLRYKKSPDTVRFAFVVSTKIDKRATQRNRMRRILSESVRHLLPRIVPMNGVIMVHKNIAGMSQKDAEDLVKRLLTEAHCII